MGWIVLQRNGRAEPDIRIENWPYAVEQPIGPVFDEGFKAVDLARSSDADLLAHDWQLAEDVVEETRGSPGAADPRTIVLRQQRGFRRALQADTALAAVLGACDGDLDLHTIVATVAGILGIDPTALTRDCPADHPNLHPGWLLALTRLSPTPFRKSEIRGARGSAT